MARNAATLWIQNQFDEDFNSLLPMLGGALADGAGGVLMGSLRSTGSATQFTIIDGSTVIEVNGTGFVYEQAPGGPLLTGGTLISSIRVVEGGVEVFRIDELALSAASLVAAIEAMALANNPEPLKRLVSLRDWDIEGTSRGDRVSFDGTPYNGGEPFNDFRMPMNGNNDYAMGGGNDMVKAGTGHDTIDGGQGSDTLYGGAGNDSLLGEGGNDQLWGGAGTDLIFGGQGLDQLRGGDGKDRLFGGEGNDTLYGDAGTDTLYGGTQADMLYGGADNDTLYGDAGIDTLNGDAGNDMLYGGADRDDLYGGAGNDSLNGDAGNDRLYGGQGRDLLIGGLNQDQLFGGAGADQLYGGNGNDLLQGDADDDLLHGGEGKDTLHGGLGVDTLTGGAGSDVFLFKAIAETKLGDKADTISDFKRGVDKINLAALDLDFGGTAAVTGKASVWFSRSPTGVAVHIDANGDGRIDGEINVESVVRLAASDFIL